MSVAAVERCLSILEALAGLPDGTELGALADAIEMPTSATHRLLATLLERGFVTQDPRTHAYALSLRMATLAFRDLEARHLPEVAQRILDDLAASTGEYCRLAVAEGETLTWIARAQGATAGLRYEPAMGRDITLHGTATGKAWLASLDENEALRIAFAQGFANPRTAGPRILRSVEALRRDLAETRVRGFGLAVEEGEAGIVALAMVFAVHPGASASGVLSVAGPLGRMGPDRYGGVEQALRRATLDMAGLWPLRRRQGGVGSNAGFVSAKPVRRLRTAS